VTRRSIGLPLALGITLSVIALLLGVGWQLIVVGDLGPVTAGLSRTHWLLIILGSVFFVLIIVGLLLLCGWLVREIRFNQRQQAFLDAVTHEMKTPIAALKLYLETLDRHDPAPERRRAFLSRMGEDVERLERTVTQVLAAARSDAPVEQRPGTPLDLTELLRQAIDETARRHTLPPEAIRMERKRPLTALGDEAELGMVFRNLLENAVKYSEASVEVRVRLEETSAGQVAVEVEDRGIGIERQELRKIFDRFYRTGRDVQRQAGLGLGLFIVRTLVRRNGGRVDAWSQGQGEGSRFRVVLRAAPGGSQPVAAQNRAAAGIA
jgi:signal transduction histidine kinase